MFSTTRTEKYIYFCSILCLKHVTENIVRWSLLIHMIDIRLKFHLFILFKFSTSITILKDLQGNIFIYWIEQAIIC